MELPALQLPDLDAPRSQPLVLEGPLDQYAAERLRLKALTLLDADGDVIFDFRDIERMHAASLQVLIALQKDLESRDRRVFLKSVDPGIRKLFSISGTEDLFEFLDGSH